jgi:formate C-acetyltransferase
MDIEEGGAEYNWVECSFVGLANLADSLNVIKNEVFKEKNFTLPQLCEMLKSDFKDCENIRQRFLNCHNKYGNACGDVDDLLPVITEFVAARCARQKVYTFDSAFIPGTFCWEMHQRLGAECGATPDGRKAGVPFADGAGPAQGREQNGPTAAVKSICSWDHSLMLGGSAFNQKYPLAVLASGESREKFMALIEAFIQGGGFETQINVIDAESLRKAVSHPDEYKDLVVRIGGYTDYFVNLPPGMQAEVIMRTLYQEI